MLDQAVERLVRRDARLDPSRGDRAAHGRGLDQLERVGRDQRGARRAARRVAGAARSLQQSRHAFRRADLQHALDRQEVDAEVERRRANDDLQRAGLETGLDPVAHLAIERAVMQREDAGPFGPRRQKRLVPDLGLAAHVGEHQRGRGLLEFRDDGVDEPDAEMTAPREALDRLGDQRVDHEFLRRLALHHRAGSRPAARIEAEQRLPRRVEVAERRRQAPRDQRRVPVPQARHRELGLHAALVAHQFVPFVDDDHRQRIEQRLRIGAREQQRQRLGRGHQGFGQLLRLPRAGRGIGVAGAHRDLPVEADPRRRFRERARGVRRERAHRRDPQHAQLAGGRRPVAPCAIEHEAQRAEPRRVGLAGAGRRMQQPRPPGADVVPGLALEGEGRDAARREPRVDRLGHRQRTRDVDPLARRGPRRGCRGRRLAFRDRGLAPLAIELASEMVAARQRRRQAPATGLRFLRPATHADDAGGTPTIQPSSGSTTSGRP